MKQAGVGMAVALVLFMPSFLRSQEVSMPTMEFLDHQARETRSSVPEKPKVPVPYPMNQNIHNDSWEALKKRVVQPENRIGTAETGPGYDVYMISSERVVTGQSCPNGAKLQNAILIPRSKQGLGRDFYPIRIRAMCSNAKDILGLVALNLDWDGGILDTPIIESKNSKVHPWCDVVNKKSAKTHDFSSCLDRLIQLFLSVPN